MSVDLNHNVYLGFNQTSIKQNACTSWQFLGHSQEFSQNSARHLIIFNRIRRPVRCWDSVWALSQYKDRVSWYWNYLYIKMRQSLGGFIFMILKRSLEAVWAKWARSSVYVVTVFHQFRRNRWGQVTVTCIMSDHSWKLIDAQWRIYALVN